MKTDKKCPNCGGMLYYWNKIYNPRSQPMNGLTRKYPHYQCSKCGKYYAKNIIEDEEILK